MARISKHTINERDFKKLSLQLSNIIAKLTKETSEGVLDDLLGPEEKIMLTKRLAAIVMYIEGHSSYRVWKSLKLSPATAAKIQNEFNKGHYRHIEDLFKKHKTDYNKFWDALDLILRAGVMPRYSGKNRWNDTPSTKTKHPHPKSKKK